MRKNIAILTGGDSAERVISLQSGRVVQKHLPDSYRTFLIDIQGKRWVALDFGIEIDKNDFSLRLAGETIRFDAVFAALHGSPLEDGKLQGYLELMGVPYTCCDGYVSALTMNKHNTKMQLARVEVPLAQSILVRQGEEPDFVSVSALGLPVFVKPNTHGSSFGVTKVKEWDGLPAAFEEAFRFGSEAVVESFLPGREFAVGAFNHHKEVVVLPATEIIPETEFFDFAAKYEGKSKEITPANLTTTQATNCAALTERLYLALHCKGVVRFDYILVGEDFYLLEANTIPGLSAASLVPQQARAAGWDLGDFFAALLEQTMEDGV